MKSLTANLRRAMEEADINTQNITIKGPLSAAITEALQQEYAKNKDLDDAAKPAMESQQIDASAMNRVAALLTTEDKPVNQDSFQVYGVSKSEIEEQDIANVATDLANMDNAGTSHYAIVVKESPDGELEERVENLNGAMESLARAKGIKIYPSMEAFAVARFG